MPMSVGYARVSTQEQDLALQLDALQAAGCARIYTEKASGAQRDRPQLQAALDYMRADDTLVVWKLDRLARSLRQLLDTVETLHARQIGLRSLTEAIDTSRARCSGQAGGPCPAERPSHHDGGRRQTPPGVTGDPVSPLSRRPERP